MELNVCVLIYVRKSYIKGLYNIQYSVDPESKTSRDTTYLIQIKKYPGLS